MTTSAIIPILIVILVIVAAPFLKIKKQNTTQSNFIVVTITPGIEPKDREPLYGDPLNDFLENNKIGEVTGGGTMLSKPDENGHQAFEFSDIEIEMISHDKANLKLLLDGLKKNNFPENIKIQLWDSPDLVFSSITSFSEYLENN